MLRRILVAAAAAALVATGADAAAPPPRPLRDGALLALNVLPPGQGASTRSETDQIPLYDALTPLEGNVTAADLRRFYKPEPLGLGGARVTRTEHPRGDVTIYRDRYEVPHVYGRTRAATEFGAGWATAEDRGVYLQLLRGPARIAALDVPGYDAFSVALSARQFVPSAQTEAFLTAQTALARKTAAGRQLVKDVDAYLAGINAYFKQRDLPVAPFTRNDVTAIGTLIGAVFGAGGGREVQDAEFLSALQQRLGAGAGLATWNDLREQMDPETPVTIARSFPYEANASAVPGTGNVEIDAGSFTGAPPPPAPRAQMSNALLVGAKRSASHHPIFVAGPQVGYFAPEILMEEDLHGGGLDARGVTFPGLGFYIQMGRSVDYAWSATSAGSDLTDEFAETLCGGDDVHYLYKGACTPMQVFDAGTLKGAGGAPDTELRYYTTVHGPVVGYATSNGRRVAIASDRASRGRELLAAIPFQKLSTAQVRSPQEFVRTMSAFELTFNWFYADSRHIAMVSSGRLPLRAPGVDGGLPTNGNGDYDWRGFLAPLAHAWTIDPPSGEIVNWNNKPAAGFGAADDTWSYGSVQRVQLLRRGIAAKQVHTPASVVAAMNAAATQDLRASLVPLLAKVLAAAPAPNARDAQALQLLTSWDGARLDRDLDGKVDAPGAAIMDAWWPRLARAVLAPRLGPLTAQLAQLQPIDENARPQGSSYGGGWYGYVDKDLRTLLGQPVQGRFSQSYCGGGILVVCAQSLWEALDEAAAGLAAAQGADPASWRADATAERIRFTGFLPATMRWANRPTFQQVVVFDRHR